MNSDQIPIDGLHDLRPQLSQGTITRGRIGVQITAVPKNLLQPWQPGLSPGRIQPSTEDAHLGSA